MTRRNRVLLALVLAAGCRDSSAPPPRPTALTLVGTPPTAAEAGASVGAGLTVVVKDQNGNPMANQPLSVAVTAGGGTITGTPSTTAQGAGTTIGTWQLGTRTGLNTLTISSGTLTPVVLSVTTTAGPPARFTTSQTATFIGTAGQALTQQLQATLTDRFDNPVSGTAVTVQVSAGGGTVAAASAPTDAAGTVTIPSWTLGQSRGANTLTATAGSATVTFNAIGQAGAPSTLTVASGGDQRALAATLLTGPATFVVRDRFGNPVPRRTAAFAVTAGAGTLAGTTAVSDTNGVIPVPAWRLGRRNTAQRVRATVDGLAQDITAQVQTEFDIEIRFYGPPMTDEQKALFTNAAERLEAMIVGDITNVNAVDFSLAANCGINGVPALNETIDDVVIYASIANIDGPGSILAQAGPCAFRTASSLPAVGVMQFDSADLPTLTGGGSLEDVITHEMMHVLGFSSGFFNLRSIILGAGTTSSRYVGPAALAACRALGGSVTCASAIPLETTGGPGTRDSHWRESVFVNELMTGFINAGTNPMSRMSIAALADLGYVVHADPADSYSLVSALRALDSGLWLPDGWERDLTPSTADLRPAAPGLMGGIRRPQ